MLPLRAVQCPSWAARCDETNARRESHTVIITSCPPLLGTNPTEWQAAASAAVAHWQPGYGSAGLQCQVGGTFTRLYYTAACAQCNTRMVMGTEQSGAARVHLRFPYSPHRSRRNGSNQAAPSSRRPTPEHASVRACKRARASLA